MKRHGFPITIMAIAVSFLLVLPALPLPIFSHSLTEAPCAFAEEPYSYGGAKEGKYGEKREVSSKEAAETLLKEHYAKKDVRIGTIREKERYYEAEILDAKGSVLDTVIVDKRTGRIRSIY